MTDHKATPQQWEMVEQWSRLEGSSASCLLELRSRVEALESANRPRVFTAEEVRPVVVPEQASTTPSGLVEQIAEQVYDAMYCAVVTEGRNHSPADIPDWRPGGNSLMQDHARVTARRILQDAADWFHAQTDTIANGSQWADRLRRESEQ